MYSDNITSSGFRSHYCICLILNKINPEKYNTQLAIANKNFTKAFDSRKAFNRIFPRTGKQLFPECRFFSESLRIIPLDHERWRMKTLDESEKNVPFLEELGKDVISKQESMYHPLQQTLKKYAP